MKKRIISTLTALALCLGMYPGWFLAAEEASSLCPAPSSGGDYETGADAAPLPEAGVPALTAEGGEYAACVTIDGNTKYCKDLNTAWDYVNGKDATLRLLKSIKSDQKDEISLVLNSGSKLTLEMDEGVFLSGRASNGLLQVCKGAELTIKSGKVENCYSAGQTNVPVVNVGVDGTAKLTISGGTVSATVFAGITANNSSAVIITGGTIEAHEHGAIINGGSFTMSGGEIKSDVNIALLLKGSYTPSLTGGTFSGGGSHGSIETESGKGISVGSLLGPGYAFQNDDGTWVTETGGEKLYGTITVKPAPVKAEIDGATSYYGTIDGAWAAAAGKIAKITLLVDAQAAAPLKVTANDNITFDGGEYTLTGPSSGDLITVDGGELSITSGTLKGTLNVTGGKATLKRGTSYSSIKAGGAKTYKDLLGEYECYLKDGNPVDIIYETQTELTDVKVGGCNHRNTRYEPIEGTTKHKLLTCAWCGREGKIETCTFESVDSATREGTCICGNHAAAVASVTNPYSHNTTYYAAIDDA